MALDKLVDSNQLNADLTSVANAIRAKGSTSQNLTFPSGFINAIQNIPTGGSTPAGTLNINSNGTYDVSDYSTAIVSVTSGSTNAKTFMLHLDIDVSGQQVVVNSGGDLELAAHRNDISFMTSMLALFTVSNTSTRAIIQGNNQMHTDGTADRYGVFLRSSASGVSASYIKYPISGTLINEPCTMNVDSSGVIRIFASSGYPMRAGDYIIVCGWAEV